MGLWTVTDDEKLKTLYGDRDLSCAGIAVHFPGKSRNSIIGRVHRLKLPLRGAARGPRRPRRETFPWIEEGKSERTWYRHQREGQPAVKPPKIAVPKREVTELRCIEIEPLHISLGDLEPYQCRFPYGDGPYTFCGHEIFQGSYCGGHFFLSIGQGTASEQQAHRVSKSKLQGAWG